MVASTMATLTKHSMGQVEIQEWNHLRAAETNLDGPLQLMNWYPLTHSSKS